MSRVDAAAASDRLPWLSDEPQPKPVKRSGGGPALGWAAAAIVTVGGAGFWMGTRSVDEQPAPVRRAPSTTIPLPEARPPEPEVRMPAQPEVQPKTAPEVRQSPAPEVRIAPPRSGARGPAPSIAPEEGTQAALTMEAPAPKPVVAAPRPQAVPLRPWNPRITQGAAGRMVQVGAFGSSYQAKRGWWFMVRAYPAMSRLPAIVRMSRNSRGRTFYRFRVGTTSQAHSEILCQRMQQIGLSCAVVGLLWKAKVER